MIKIKWSIIATLFMLSSVAHAKTNFIGCYPLEGGGQECLYQYEDLDGNNWYGWVCMDD